ncbi:MAG TPA: SDR family oxidoreductase [Solirubrobacteraceae bacterium]|jgi:NAD(P)-dependent dehydrogenase (short-subunit alcohol dehydrogenase family)|nr:SDR family oxidoreductase [Solirubrobacteraceae bacterium]
MSTAASAPPIQREPELLGQTVVVIGGTAGIGLATARRARSEGADVIVTARNPDRLEQVERDLGARGVAAFDANDTAALGRFFDGLDNPIDHVMVTAGGPRYGRLMDMDADEARSAFSEHLVQVVEVARLARTHVRPGGALAFMGGTGARRPALGSGAMSTVAVALPALIANLALELSPIRVNLIAAGFVDTGLSASILGDDLDARRDQLRATLPIRRVVEPADVGALAVQLMVNRAVTGATYDIDGGQQFVE